MKTLPMFSILITTKNRKDDLAYTLEKIGHLLQNNIVECLIYDDGSTDGTYEWLVSKHSQIRVFRNEKSRGLIHNRNVLLNSCQGKFAISLDDDAHFVSGDVLEKMKVHFEQNPNCGVIAFRIFWGKNLPENLMTNEVCTRVKGFVGCGHVWRMDAWRDIPDYPEWFVFYGEEEHAAYQLFQKGWQVHYMPQVLVNHRVDLRSRKKDPDYGIRSRRSLRSGWYLYFLFAPWSKIPRSLAYSLWTQVKSKTFKGDRKASVAIGQAVIDLLRNLPRLIKERNALTLNEFEFFKGLPETKTYWKPENEK